jgi:hypothetical protein
MLLAVRYAVSPRCFLADGQLLGHRSAHVSPLIGLANTASDDRGDQPFLLR